MKQPLNAELIPYSLPARGVQSYAVRFDGFEGGRLAGWYLRPERNGRFPGVCVYHGYSGRGKVRPLDLIHLAAQGMCVLSMDCRGQNGQSQDTSVAAEGHHSGWMTKGIRSPKTYYYRYVYSDAVRALELLAAREEVDATRLAITGGSSGGRNFAGGLVAFRTADSFVARYSVPVRFSARDLHRARRGLIREIPGFCKAFPHLYEQVISTLSYFDCLNLAPRIKCRTVISNCLWDDICPPSTIFGVYNHIVAEKQIEVYPFHKHDIPYDDHYETKFRLLMETLNP